MTDLTDEYTKARQVFSDRLTRCPNPKHEFKNRFMVGEWQWAVDEWNTLGVDGLLTTHHIHFCSQRTVDGIVLHTLVLGKFSISVSFIR